MFPDCVHHYWPMPPDCVESGFPEPPSPSSSPPTWLASSGGPAGSESLPFPGLETSGNTNPARPSRRMMTFQSWSERQSWRRTQRRTTSQRSWYERQSSRRTPRQTTSWRRFCLVRRRSLRTSTFLTSVTLTTFWASKSLTFLTTPKWRHCCRPNCWTNLVKPFLL